MVMLNVIRELCNEPDFQERLDSVLGRIGDIESLGRTRELLWKSVGAPSLEPFLLVVEMDADYQDGRVACVCVCGA